MFSFLPVVPSRPTPQCCPRRSEPCDPSPAPQSCSSGNGRSPERDKNPGVSFEYGRFIMLSTDVAFAGSKATYF